MNRFLLFFLFPMVLLAQDKIPDFNITGAGARAEGFGGAFIGLADDATAVVWNPAGLSQLERPEASVVTRIIGETNSYMNNDDPTYNTDESQSTFALNFSSFAIPITKGEMAIVAAIAFQRQLDFADNRRRQFEFTDDLSNKITLDQKVETTGGVNTITPAISVKVSPIISFGVSANIWTGSIVRDENFVYKENSADIRLRSKTEADYSGFNMVFGGLVDFEGMQSGGFPLKIGATFRTPFSIDAEGDDDQEAIDQLNRRAADRAAVTQKIEMPLMLGFGASYRMGENLTIAADFEMRNFKGNTVTNSSSSRVFGDTSYTSSISESDDNLNQFRIGAEYLIVMDQGVIPLRAGFKTVPTVLANYVYDDVTDQDLPTNNQVRGSGLSLGTGFISETFAFDLTLGVTSYTQKFHPYGSIDYSIITVGSSVIIYF
jgi:long-subunit fatty acid transport protein